MINLTLNDETQVEILKHLSKTEDLLTRLATKLSGSEQAAEIYAMPDLGFPSNVQRIHGGFFTGAYYKWTTTVPFTPVDVTLNSCGISLFKLSAPISSETEFNALVQKTIDVVPKTTYVWNFATGNHFITYGEVVGSSVVPDGYYLMQHSSAAEFKKQYNGLYPAKDNWFYDSIETFKDEDSPRYLRYISGSKAELFAKKALMLQEYNKVRHQFFAHTLVGSNRIDKEVLNVQHYGMPTPTSVAIGCQWNAKDFYVLLTAPGKPIFFIEPELTGKNVIQSGKETLVLTPHGLGMKSVTPPTVEYLPNSLKVSDTEYQLNDALKGKQAMVLRSFNETAGVPKTVSDILEKCPGKVVGSFTQIYSYYNKPL